MAYPSRGVVGRQRPGDAVAAVAADSGVPAGGRQRKPVAARWAWAGNDPSVRDRAPLPLPVQEPRPSSWPWSSSARGGAAGEICRRRRSPRVARFAEAVGVGREAWRAGTPGAGSWLWPGSQGVAQGLGRAGLTSCTRPGDRLERRRLSRTR